MGMLNIEKVGGFAGFGPRSHLRSRGQLLLETLSPDDRAVVERLLASKVAHEGNPLARDSFAYRITHETPSGSQTIEVPEELVPAALKEAVKDTLA